MTSDYDPDRDTHAGDWLALDESERIARVEEYHLHWKIAQPQPRLHAAIHVVVENQLALGESPAVEALQRLRSDGLTRHDAVHAIGMAVAEHMGDVVARRLAPGVDPNAAYADRLRHLRAPAAEPGAPEVSPGPSAEDSP